MTQKGRPWTMTLSLTLQCAVVAAIILWSIVHIQSLGPIHIPDPLPPFPRAAAVKVVDVQRSAVAAAMMSVPVARRPFTAPTRIQSAEIALAQLDAMPAVDVPGGGIGAMDGVVNTIVDFADRLSRGGGACDGDACRTAAASTGAAGE